MGLGRVIGGHVGSRQGLSPEWERINSCQAMLRSIAWQISLQMPRNLELEDLISEGQIGLLHAARDYDPSRGAQFSTFAYWKIRGAILDWASRQDWFDLADYHAGRLATGEEGEQERPGLALKKGTEDVADQRADNPAEQASENELRGVLRHLINNMSGRAGQILQATVLQGKTLEEAGMEAGIHKGTAQRAQVQAFDELAESIREKGLAEMKGEELRQYAMKSRSASKRR